MARPGRHRRAESSATALAAAVRKVAREAAERSVNVLLAEVVRDRPLKVEMLSGSLVLDDDDFSLSSWADFYTEMFGVEVGDTALLVREAGDYVVFDFISDTDIKFPDARTYKALAERLANAEQRIHAIETAGSGG